MIPRPAGHGEKQSGSIVYCKSKAAYQPPLTNAAPSILFQVKAQKTLGQNINKLRTQKKLTQNLLADFADVDRRFLQRIEAGASGPTIQILLKLKRALGCSWSELLKGIE